MSLIYQVTTKKEKQNGCNPPFSHIDLYKGNSNHTFANLKTKYRGEGGNLHFYFSF